jgi:hypothetical protein
MSPLDSALEIATLRRLADDIERIQRGDAPTAAELETAPLLSGWMIEPALTACLSGAVFGHPRLGSRSFIRTSAVHILSRDGTWARTYSRFYRLSDPALPTEAGHA